MVPLALAAGIVVVVLAPGTTLTVASAIYAVTGLLLFAVSATYRLGTWSPRTARVLKRLDHTNILLIIAGTYTPLTLALLPEPRDAILLTSVWFGATGGVAFRLLWTDAPRWLYTIFYIVLGLAAVVFIGDFFAAECSVCGADMCGRGRLHHRCGVLRDEAAEHLPAVVRVPRALPCVHAGRVHLSLRRYYVRRARLARPDAAVLSDAAAQEAQGRLRGGTRRRPHPRHQRPRLWRRSGPQPQRHERAAGTQRCRPG